MLCSRHTSRIDLPASASRKMRILSSVVYRLPFMLGPFFRPQTNISSGSKKRSHVTGTGAHNLEQAGRDLSVCASAISNDFAFGTLQIDGGTVSVVDDWPNLGGQNTVYAQALTGTGTLNIGAGMRFYFNTTNGWSG